jgi:hypothetical protein
MLDLGYQGENKARTIEIDMTAWLEEFPGAKVGMMVRRPGEATLYPADIKHDRNIIRWGIKSGDVAIAGEGEAQIILTNEEGVQLRSRVVKTKITVSLSGTEVEAPPPQTNWVGEVLQAADKAKDAVGHMPVIGENGNWFAWNADKKSYEDTGNPSQGEPGKDGGGYYTPTVEQTESETLRVNFTPSNAEMPAVAPVDVTLPQGPAGNSPVKGTDYWTAGDRAAIKAEALADLAEVQTTGTAASVASLNTTVRELGGRTSTLETKVTNMAEDISNVQYVVDDLEVFILEYIFKIGFRMIRLERHLGLTPPVNENIDTTLPGIDDVYDDVFPE